MSRNLGRAALAEDSLHLVFSRHCGETLYPCLRVTYRCEKDYINILSETTWSRTSVPFVRKFISVRCELFRQEEDRIARYERFCSGVHVGRLSPSIVRLHLPSRSPAPTLGLFSVENPRFASAWIILGCAFWDRYEASDRGDLCDLAPHVCNVVALVNSNERDLFPVRFKVAFGSASRRRGFQGYGLPTASTICD